MIAALVTLGQVAAQDTYRYKRNSEYKDDSQARWSVDASIGGHATISAHRSRGDTPP